ncbi:cystathionine beta-synthase, partial [Enterococcus hirae]
ATVTVAPEDTLLIAYGRMKLYDVSQLPVLDAEDRVVGIIDESDILLAVTADEARFKEPVKEAMTHALETVQADQAIEDILPVLRRGHVAIV